MRAESRSLPDVLQWPALVLLGIAVGAYGTLIGAGGGFVLTPALLLLYPDHRPEVITSISLGVVFFNAASGSVAYGRQRRIDYPSALMFAAATLPGAVGGAVLTAEFPRDAFEAAFGVLLLLVAGWLALPRSARVIVTQPPARYRRRQLTDARGDTYVYSFDPYLGVGLGLAIGFISSLFGVGGGIIYVPAMVLLMRFPSYIATATSTFTLMFTSGAGALVHVIAGDFSGVLGEELSLAAGVLLGAQLGALVSMRLQARQLVVMRLLSGALGLVGLRLVFGALL
ncbi:MAG TPA: sulfite exporter TauE/SafE family protein [Dehalococcoidia bacterium]|nr:sulfite exporter TauE/SafE family protein [Dehalococcoidia bacterium]